MKKNLYIAGTVINLATIVYLIVITIKQICFNYNGDIIYNPIVLGILSIGFAVSMIMYLVNICNNLNSPYLQVLYIGFVLVNPIISIMLLKNKFSIVKVSKPYRVVKRWWYYSYMLSNGCNVLFLMWLSVILVFCILTTEPPEWLVPKEIVTGLVMCSMWAYQCNCGISEKHESFIKHLLVVCGMMFYSPFYTLKVLRNHWI